LADVAAFDNHYVDAVVDDDAAADDDDVDESEAAGVEAADVVDSYSRLMDLVSPRN
jgi:hypothetical protein